MGLKVDVEKIESCRRQLKIEVPAEKVSTKFEETYKKIRKVASLPGFRAGHVPEELIKKHYHQDAKRLVIEDLLPEYYVKALEKVDFHPVQDPEFSDIEVEEGRSLLFKASMDIKPKFKLGAYTGLKINRREVKVEPQEIEAVLLDIQRQATKYHPVKERPVRKGDLLNCDFLFSMEGKIIRDQKKTAISLEDNFLGPEFVQNLEGVSAGQKKEFDIILPEGFEQKEWADKPAHFEIKVKEIQEKEIPEINDDLAKMAGNSQTLDELRRVIEQELLKRKERESKDDLERQIVEELIKNNKFDVPVSLIEGETEILVKNAKMRLLYQGFSKDQVDGQEEKLREQLRQNAKRNIQALFILSEITQKEGLKITDQELDERLKTMAGNSQQKEDDMRKYLKEKNMLDNLRWEMLNQKVMDFLIKENSSLHSSG